MAPIVHRLQDDYWGEVQFIYLQQEDPLNNNFKRDLGFRYRPHFFLLDAEGNILWQALGSVPEDLLIEQLEAALGN